jgi:hypothetical protein
MRCISLVAFLLLGVWGAHGLRPVVQILSGPLTCCVECKKNFCPAKKPTATSAKPSCHSTESSSDQNKMSRTCNHSTDVQMLHPDAILVQENFSLNNHIFYQQRDSVALISFEPQAPVSPPPKTV